jgi:hypothetical protein
MITILIFLLTILYNLVDFYRIYNIIKKTKTGITFIKNLKEKLNILKKQIKGKKVKEGNLYFFYKNLRKISKHINSKTIYPLILFLLFSNYSITFNESDNDIHHYILKKNGELIEVTNAEEKIRLEKEKLEKEELEKRIELEDFVINLVIFAVIATITLTIIIYFFTDYGGGGGNGGNRDIIDGYDLTNREQKMEFLRTHPEYRNEPVFTEYQKKWLGQEERLKQKTTPFYTGPPTGDGFHTLHYDPEYVDEYNEYIIEWEDDHVYKTNRCWRDKSVYSKEAYKPFDDKRKALEKNIKKDLLVTVWEKIEKRRREKGLPPIENPLKKYKNYKK